MAIAKGDIPQEAWFRLGRAHTLFRGERVLLSWTGTMFEYLMPHLWMRHIPDTIMEQSMQAVVRVQQRAWLAARAFPGASPNRRVVGAQGGPHGYAAFGMPALALKRQDSESLVISPYASLAGADGGPGGRV